MKAIKLTRSLIGIKTFKYKSYCFCTVEINAVLYRGGLSLVQKASNTYFPGLDTFWTNFHTFSTFPWENFLYSSFFPGLNIQFKHCQQYADEHQKFSLEVVKKLREVSWTLILLHTFSYSGKPKSACSTVRRGTTRHFPPRPTKLYIPPGSVTLCQTCPEWTEHWFRRRPNTARHCISEVVQIVSSTFHRKRMREAS